MADGVAWETIKQAAAGDASAKGQLVDATLDGLWVLAMRLVRRADEADDIVQETYARAFAALPGLASTGKFEGFLARVATNLVIEQWRRRRPTTDVDDCALSAEAIEPWQSVAADEDQRRRLAAIWTAVQDLEPQPRAALILYYAQNESYDSISQILDVPLGTVKVWLHRARNEVRQKAERRLGTEPAAARLE